VNPRGERENWGKLISFADRDGVFHLATLTDADLHRDAGALVASLADKGMNIEGSLTAHRAFVEYLLSVNAETPITLARRGGWQSLQSPAVYMLTDEMAVKESGAAVEKTILAATVYAPYEKAGMLAGWRQDVGQVAKGHRLAMLAIATAPRRRSVRRRLRKRRGPCLRLVEHRQDIVLAPGRLGVGQGRHRRDIALVAGDFERPRGGAFGRL
jgi:hypothetical protein